MIAQNRRRALRCAVYTRKSTEEGLERKFNTLEAQREAGETFIESQRREGWRLLRERFDDGGYTGANLQRPALKRMLERIEAGEVDAVVVYKLDRLTRSLADFAKLMEVFEARGVALVSVTQQLNTGTSMGRLRVHVLLSFAQFEREMIAERTRDKHAAARRRGKWTGGSPLLGYDLAGSLPGANRRASRAHRSPGPARLRGDSPRAGVRTRRPSAAISACNALSLGPLSRVVSDPKP